MDTNRANLDQLQSNTKYIILTVILIILSIIGVFLFFKIRTVKNEPVEVEPTVVPTVEPVSTIIIEEPTGGELVESTPSEITEAPPEAPTPTPAFQTYDGAEDGFTLSYMSDRKVYKITESTGHRIAFYRIGGNIAVHVGNDWSWSHPGREFNGTFTLSGEPAFRYDITAQTLIDVKYKDRFYTIQCLHNSDENLKSECEQLITSFKFL